MPAIQRASTMFGVKTADDAWKFVQSIAVQKGYDPNSIPPPYHQFLRTDLPAAVARIDHGRWIADCPDPNCDPSGSGRGAMAVDESHFFMCGNCFNRAAGGYWLTVEWPDDDDKHSAEAILTERPHAVMQTWHPKRESMADLVGENVSIKARVPKLRGKHRRLEPPEV